MTTPTVVPVRSITPEHTLPEATPIYYDVDFVCRELADEFEHCRGVFGVEPSPGATLYRKSDTVVRVYGNVTATWRA